MKIKLYRWTIEYDKDLADNWLNWKERTATDAERDAVALMKSVVVQGKRPILNEPAKNLIAEYLAYSNAPSSASAHLFYVVEEDGLIDGWSIFPDLGSPKPLTIKVAPEENSATGVTLVFTQPGYKYRGEAGNGLQIEGSVKDFRYKVDFRAPNEGRPELIGTLWHPDVGSENGDGIKVGETKLFLRIKGEAGGGNSGSQVLQPIEPSQTPGSNVAVRDVTVVPSAARRKKKK
jgi:hypothetical protein